MESQVEKILFWEEKLTWSDVEQFVFPFEQSGYLTAEQKLELLLFDAEKREKEGGHVCLLTELAKNKTIITEETISDLYLQRKREERCFFSWEEKKEILVRRLACRLGIGVVGMLVRIGGDAIEFGTYGSNKENKIGVRKGDITFRFPFLEFSSEEEVERTVRNLINREKHGEITVQNPLWCHERQDGIKLYASRPPASPHWGMIIIFENERNCQSDREDWFCGL